MGDEPTRGTYTLIVEVRTASTTVVGALGEQTFQPGWYAYAGSALGTGGFARIDRHRAVARGVRDSRHWHVDYLLGLESAAVDTSVRTADVDGECAVAAATELEPISGFGASDCGCPTHLHYAPQRDALVGEVEGAHRRLRSRRSQT